MRVYVGFPVEIPDRQFGETKFPNLHVTLAYWPNITAVEANKIADWIASTSVWAISLSGYHVFDTWTTDLFGPNEDIPVLRIRYGYRGWNDMAEALRNPPSGLPPADTTYDFNPHITIPLRLAIKQPSRLVIRPIHMWRGKRDPHPIVRKK